MLHARNLGLGQVERLGELLLGRAPGAAEFGQGDLVGGDLLFEGSARLVRDGVTIGAGAQVDWAIVASRARIGAGARVGHGAVIGHDAEIAAGTDVPENARVAAECRPSTSSG